MKIALITGASSGIGEAAAFEFAKNGYDLVLVARRKELLETIKDSIENAYGVSVTNIPMDLSKTDSADNLYKQTSEQKINVLINNAGFGLYGNFIDHDAHREEEMLLLNILTLTKLTRYFAKDMLKNKGGHIINIASTAAFQPVPGLAVYAATKSYVMNFSESLAYELKNTPVNVMTICPGPTQSEFGKVAGFQESRIIGAKKTPTSEDLAKFIYRSMKKNRTNAIHGFKNNLLMQFNRCFPRKWTTAVAAMMTKTKPIKT